MADKSISLKEARENSRKAAIEAEKAKTKAKSE